MNEGYLGTHNIKANKIYSEIHPPVILNGTLKEGHKKIELGSILQIDDTGALDVIAAATSASATLQIAGVSLENVDTASPQGYIQYLAHGIVKADSLKGADGALYTETAKLKAVGIYID